MLEETLTDVLLWCLSLSLTSCFTHKAVHQRDTRESAEPLPPPRTVVVLSFSSFIRTSPHNLVLP